MSGGRITWEVPTGRRDGLVSSSSEPGTFLPRPTATVATLKSQFAAVGLTTDQMVTLSGTYFIEYNLIDEGYSVIDPCTASLLAAVHIDRPLTQNLVTDP
jgi:hypothetical protein